MVTVAGLVDVVRVVVVLHAERPAPCLVVAPFAAEARAPALLQVQHVGQRLELATARHRVVALKVVVVRPWLDVTIRHRRLDTEAAERDPQRFALLPGWRWAPQREKVLLVPWQGR